MSNFKDKSPRAYLIFLLGLFISAVGDSLNFKAAIGVNPYEAVQLTAFYISGVKVGTFAMLCNFFLLGGQLLFQKKITLPLILQIPVTLLQGNLFNLIIYFFLGRLELGYPMRFVFLLCGIVLAAVGVGMMVFADVAVFPLEGFCQKLAGRIGVDFARVRQAADILFVAGCLAVSFLFHYPYAIREGTVISAVLFSPIMSAVMRWLQKSGAKSFSG